MIALVDTRLGETEERALMLHGARVIRLPASKRLSEAVCSHPDILIFYNDGEIITSADYIEENPYALTDAYEWVYGLKVTCTDDAFDPKYPRDAIFNALVHAGYIFYKEDTVSHAVKEYAKRRGLKPIAVKQGYPACTTLAFGNAAITSDRGMARALLQCGIKVTLIENGDIALPPHEYGFIGGASGVYKDKVYFIGNLSSHRDGERIKKAILDEGYTPVSLSRAPLRDLGRIIFIDECAYRDR